MNYILAFNILFCRSTFASHFNLVGIKDLLDTDSCDIAVKSIEKHFETLYKVINGFKKKVHIIKKTRDVETKRTIDMLHLLKNKAFLDIKDMVEKYSSELKDFEMCLTPQEITQDFFAASKKIKADCQLSQKGEAVCKSIDELKLLFKEVESSRDGFLKTVEALHILIMKSKDKKILIWSRGSLSKFAHLQFFYTTYCDKNFKLREKLVGIKTGIINLCDEWFSLNFKE